MAAEGSVITFIFTGERDREGNYIIPRNATHFIAHASVTVIPEGAFQRHPNIIEVICHAGVIIIEQWAFYSCPRLKRVVIPGVEVVEEYAFCGCQVVTDIECERLERIKEDSFQACNAISSINLLSARVVEDSAFYNCPAIKDVKFSKDLESIQGGAFARCRSLERITIPLKNGLITYDNTFTACENLKHVDLIEGPVLHETVDALLLEEWKDDMGREIYSINQILPNTYAGEYYDGYGDAYGGKARVIREWITRVLRKIIQYKREHRHLVSEATTTLQLQFALPRDIVMNNVLPFLDLPSHTFEGEDYTYTRN